MIVLFIRVHLKQVRHLRIYLVKIPLYFILLRRRHSVTHTAKYAILRLLPTLCHLLSTAYTVQPCLHIFPSGYQPFGSKLFSITAAIRAIIALLHAIMFFPFCASGACHYLYVTCSLQLCIPLHFIGICALPLISRTPSPHSLTTCALRNFRYPFAHFRASHRQLSSTNP